MPWTKIDDDFLTNAKVTRLSDAAFRAYALSMVFCSKNLTDGIVDTGSARSFGWTKRAKELVASGVWEVTDGGWMVHDYLVYNPTREKVLKERADAAARVAKYRAGNGDGSQVGNAVTDVDTNECSNTPSPIPIPDPVPRSPDSEPDSPASEISRAPQHADAGEVYRMLESSLGIFGNWPEGWAESWLQSRTLAQIRDAIGKARENSAHNTRYVDRILEKPPAPVGKKTYSSQFDGGDPSKPKQRDHGPYEHLVHRGA